MAAHTYEESKSIASRTIIILGIVTIVEVLIALVGKGHLFSGFVPYESYVGGFPLGRAIMYLLMIGFSLYKAALVVFEFMHMKYEVKGLMRSVLLPMGLLFWAIIAFFMEGNYWKESREGIQEKDNMEVQSKMEPIGGVKPAAEATHGGH